VLTRAGTHVACASAGCESKGERSPGSRLVVWRWVGRWIGLNVPMSWCCAIARTRFHLRAHRPDPRRARPAMTCPVSERAPGSETGRWDVAAEGASQGAWRGVSAGMSGWLPLASRRRGGLALGCQSPWRLARRLDESGRWRSESFGNGLDPSTRPGAGISDSEALSARVGQSWRAREPRGTGWATRSELGLGCQNHG
jgi:hypothetical protein